MGGNRTLLPGVSLQRSLLPTEIFPQHGSLVSCRQRWHCSQAAVHTAESLKSQRDSWETSAVPVGFTKEYLCRVMS